MSLINPAILLDPPCEPGCPRKRRRLDNLTPEERALRRKLKNRVAAQTARDRKKARMTELEESLAAYEEENKKLLRENKELQKRASNLAAENNELKARLGLTPPSSPESSSDDVSSQLSSVTAAMPSPPRSPSQEESRVVIKQEKESPEYAAGTISDSFSFSPHDYCATESTQSDELFSFLEDFKPGNPDEFITIKEEPEDVLNVCSGGKRETKVKEGVEGYQGLSEGVGKTPKCLESTSEFMTSNELDKAIETYAAEPSMNENMWWEESFPDLFPALVDV